MKRILLISALYLIFQTAFAQKQDTKLTPSPEINFQTYTASLVSSIDDLGLVDKFVNANRLCLKTNNSQHVLSSEALDIARNRGGKQGEGRLPTAYSESLSKTRILKPTIGIDRNSDGKQGDGIFPGVYSMDLSKSCTGVIVDDIARNCGGRNSN